MSTMKIHKCISIISAVKCSSEGKLQCDKKYAKGQISGKSSWKRKQLSWVFQEEEELAEWGRKKWKIRESFKICRLNVTALQTYLSLFTYLLGTIKITCWWDLTLSWTNWIVASQLFHLRFIKHFTLWSWSWESLKVYEEESFPRSRRISWLLLLQYYHQETQVGKPDNCF